MQTSSPGAIFRTNLAPTMSSAAVSLATTQPLSSPPSTSGRKPCGSRAAYSVCSSMKTSGTRPWPAAARSPRRSRPRWPPDRRLGAGRVATLNAARSLRNSAVSTSVSDVAATGAARSGPASRAASSRVLIRFPLCPRARLVLPASGKSAARWPDRGPGGRVPAMTHRDVAAERGQGGLVEYLGDQPHLLVHHDAAAVADRDARGLLPPVLQRVQAEVGELGHILVGAQTPNTPHASRGGRSSRTTSSVRRPSGGVTQTVYSQCLLKCSGSLDGPHRGPAPTAR